MLLLLQFLRREVGDGYPVSVNLNYNWMWGSVSGLFLTVQLVSGILLAMHYTANVDMAFFSVEHIMRDVNYGWILRYIHANGASFFFIALYSHIAKNLYFKLYLNNYKAWFTWIIIFILSMATAFIGYVLPWGQMSFWGATVITNLFSAVPVIGTDLVYWLWSGFSVDNPTLNKFFSLHYLLPIIIAVFVIIHLFYLHKGNSSNPLGVLVSDRIAFYPYLVLKDVVGVLIIFFIFFIFIIYYPNLLGHSDNYIQANSLVTPSHIVPEWYFLPFYAILRAVPDKLGGVICMFAALLVLFLLPLTDRDICFSSRFKKVNVLLWWFFFGDFLFLGWLGGQAVEYPFVILSVIATIYYFLHLLVILPRFSYIQMKIDNFKNTFKNSYDLPMPWQMQFQDSASPAMEGISDLYADVMSLIVGILLFVGWMLGSTIYYFSWYYALKNFSWWKSRETSNQTPASSSKEMSSILGYAFLILPSNWKYYSAHVSLEIVWTIIPGVILVIIAIPSLSLLFALDDVIFSGSQIVTVVGAQWYWIYQHRFCGDADVQDSNFLSNEGQYSIKALDAQQVDKEYFQIESDSTTIECYDSRMTETDDLNEGDLRLLTVDNWLVFPRGSNVTFFITSQDVLHSFAIPALGIKLDACPGRLNSVTINMKRPGLYYGQCSEICGVNHAFMPIMIEIANVV